MTLTVEPILKVDNDGKIIETNMEKTDLHTETIILENGIKIIIFIPE